VPETSRWFGKTVTVTELRWYNTSPVIFLEGIDDRNKAEELIKAILLVNADSDDLPAEEDAWYDHQLIGLKVERDGQVIGQVIRVEHLPAQDRLVVQFEDREVFVPFVKEIVPEVNITTGKVTVTPPNGLFEELPEAE
jgi:16S rRNA processing protein RimM